MPFNGAWVEEFLIFNWIKVNGKKREERADQSLGTGTAEANKEAEKKAGEGETDR